MSQESSDPRTVSGHTPARASLDGKSPAADQEVSTGSIAIALVVRAVRHHLPLISALTTLTTAVALFIFRQPAVYQATALIRLAEERRTVSAAMEHAVPELDRNIAPLQSLVPRLRSRTLIGRVVDSLGLRLRPLPNFSLWEISTAPVLGLKNVKVDSDMYADTLYLSFSDSTVLVERDTARREARYGTPLRLGLVQLTVPARPSVDRAAVLVLPREVAIDRVLLQLAIVPVTGTDALQVKYLDSDPSTAQQIANQIVEAFNSGDIGSWQEQARRRRLFLAEQLAQTDRLLGQAQASLSAFRSRHNLANSADRVTLQQSAIMTLDTRRGDLQADLQVFESLLAQLQSPNDSVSVEGLRNLAYSPEIASDPIVGKLYQQLLVYRTRLDSLTTGPWQSSAINPDVVQLHQLLISGQAELARAVRTRVSSLKTRIAALTQLRNASASQLQALPAFLAEEAQLAQQVSSLSDFASQLRLEFQRSRLSEELPAGDIEIVDLASQPYLPAGIPWWVKTAVAMVLGLGLATGLATLLEVRNRSIRGPEELEQVLQVPGLGVIPQLAEAEASRGLIGGAAQGNGKPGDSLFKRSTPDAEQPSIGAEAFRLLYSSLTYGWGNRHRTIIVTSVAPQEGKTLIAANLAATFAREGARVLLVDCDMRRPRLHKIFQVRRAPGLMEVLRFPAGQEPPVEQGDTDVKHGQPTSTSHSYSMFTGLQRPSQAPSAHLRLGFDGLHRETENGSARGAADNDAVSPGRTWDTNITATKIKGLFLLTSGALPPNPAEVLTVGAFRTVLHNLSEQFDVVILDTPPALVSADAVILAPLADDVLMVVRAGYTDRDAVEQARQHLTAAGARVVGAVLNDPEGKVTGHGMLYYGYSYPTNRD